jgi:hypothetical protein
MSTVFYNHIAVSGARPNVLQFRKDARRRLPTSLQAQLHLSTIDLSFERLFQLHPQLRYSERRIPADEYHYSARFWSLARWHEGTQARYTLEVKNTQIHEMLLPLSRCYPDVCFVNSELCLDDGSIMGVFTRRGRQSKWDLPEARSDAHWAAAASQHGVYKMDDAYEDDDIRGDAESAGLSEAVQQWDDRVRRVLRRALPAGSVLK